MALSQRFKSLDIDAFGHVASCEFNFTDRADIPLLGSTVTWVEDFDGDAIGGALWYVSGVKIHPSIEVFNRMTITARQVGYNWVTADPSTGNTLGVIANRNFYDLNPWTKNEGGVLTLGYWHIFSNWPSGSDFTTSDPDPIQDNLLTWEIEFVTTTVYSGWQNKKNGTWPTGIVPPLGTGAGLYLCRGMDIEVEPTYHPTTGAETILYRHFAKFWEAPTVAATQMAWDKLTWT